MQARGTFLSAAAVLLLPICVAFGGTLPPIQTVFIILMENASWSQIKGSASAPYINNTLLPMASYCEGYYNVPGVHPSLPNYLWLEAGTNFNITDDNAPSINHQNTTNHLVTLLRAAGVSWKTYQEDITGTYIPLTPYNGYAPKHNPFVYFDDVTDTNNLYGAYGIAHIRPYTELATDLTNNTVARYNFITPDLCDDMHNSCAPIYDPIKQGDTWLAREVPKIMGSQAYSNCGALFITWDESYGTDPRIGMILLSPLARGGGYTNAIYYTHSSMLRTLQEAFGVVPLLRGAAGATNLSDLFSPAVEVSGLRITSITNLGSDVCSLAVSGVNTNMPLVVLASADLKAWSPVSTNVCPPSTCTIGVTNCWGGPVSAAFYRLHQD